MILKYITTEQAIAYLQEKQYDLVENHGFSRECLDARDKEKYDIYEKIIQDVKKYATIDTACQNKSGHWKNITRSGFTTWEATCSACGRRMIHLSTYHYCPNCGAEMKVEE